VPAALVVRDTVGVLLADQSLEVGVKWLVWLASYSKNHSRLTYLLARKIPMPINVVRANLLAIANGFNLSQLWRSDASLGKDKRKKAG
jgi:hypothetical protein